MPGDNVEIEVELIYKVALNEGLRFAIREGGRQFKSAWDYFFTSRFGGLAQLARAPALQAGGQRFESVILHQVNNLYGYELT